MYVRQREEAPVIQRIGDIFLEAATEFRIAYPSYVGHLPLAEKRLKEEMEHNAEFRRFLEVNIIQLLCIGKPRSHESIPSNARDTLMLTAWTSSTSSADHQSTCRSTRPRLKLFAKRPQRAIRISNSSRRRSRLLGSCRP